MTTISARNLTVGALSIDDLKVPNRVFPGSSDTDLTTHNRITDIQEDSQLLSYINADQVVLLLDGVVQTKAQSLNIMIPVITGTTPTFSATTDTNGGVSNAGFLVALDGTGNLDGRDVGADGAVLDAHVGNTSNPHSTAFGTLSDTDLTGVTQGSVAYFDGTNWVQLSPGTAGQLLQTQGAGADPQWQTSSLTDELVGVSANDTTPSYLSAKLITTTSGVTYTEINDGGDENFRLDIDTASDTSQGLIELATQTEVDTGTDTSRSVTPATLASATTVLKPGDSAGGDLNGTLPNPTVTDLTISGEVQGSVLYFDGTNWVSLSPGTDGQILQTGGSGANPEWVSISTIDNSNIAQYRNSSVQTINATATVAVDTTDFEDSNYSLATNEITINTTGVYRISYNVVFDTTTNNRRTISTFVENNTVQIPGSGSYDYARNNTDDMGAAGCTFFVSLTATDVIRLRANSSGTSGSLDVPIDGVVFNFEFVR